jgi:hypothetical protein
MKRFGLINTGTDYFHAIHIPFCLAPAIAPTQQSRPGDGDSRALGKLGRRVTGHGNGPSRACLLGLPGWPTSLRRPGASFKRRALIRSWFPQPMASRDTDSVKPEDKLETKHITRDMCQERLKCRMPQCQGDVLAMFSP